MVISLLTPISTKLFSKCFGRPAQLFWGSGQNLFFSLNLLIFLPNADKNFEISNESRGSEESKFFFHFFKIFGSFYTGYDFLKTLSRYFVKNFRGALVIFFSENALNITYVWVRRGGSGTTVPLDLAIIILIEGGRGEGEG